MKHIFNDIRLVVVSYILSILIAAFIFSSVESRNFIDSIYWAFVTSLTIGYGDVTPKSDIAKIITVLFGHFWIFFIIPAIISNMLNKMIHDRNEFTHEEQEEIRKYLKTLVDKLDAK